MKYEIGEVIFKKDAPVEINEGKEVTALSVINNGDRTVQVCSHYHFFETNLALSFDREKSFGKRLDIPSGTAVRFEPGEAKKVGLIPFAGQKKVIGFKGVTMGDVNDPEIKKTALAKMDKLVKGGDR